MSSFWKVIEDFPNYAVNRNGDFRNIKRNRSIQPLQGPDGYCRVRLTNKEGKGKMLLAHRLVAEAFIPNPEKKPVVNHKDGNRGNNKTENLEWVTSSENKLHGYRVLKHVMTEETKKKISKAHAGKKLTEEHKKKISLRNMGRPVSTETREKISKANRISHRTQEYREKMSKIRKNYFKK